MPCCLVEYKFLWIIILSVVVMKPVSSADPVITGIMITDPAYLNTGTVTEISCNATIDDSDGYLNLSNVAAVLYDSVEANATSIDDNNNHYTNSSCVIIGTGNTSNVSCSFLLWYYANPGTWVCNMTASDGIGTTSNVTNTTVAELVGMSVTGLLYHNGTGEGIPLGNTSAEALMNITNTGNVDLGIELSGQDMGCDIGTIPVSSQRYNTTAGFSYASGKGLTNSSVSLAGFIVARRTDDLYPSSNYIYFMLMIPPNGIGGACNGTIHVNAQ